MFRLSAMLLLPLLGGCFGMSESKFFNKFSNEACKNLQQCEPDYFDDHFDSRSECVDELMELYEAWVIKPYADAGCEFNSSEARACLRAARGMGCDDDFDDDDDSCEDLYTCP